MTNSIVRLATLVMSQESWVITAQSTLIAMTLLMTASAAMTTRVSASQAGILATTVSTQTAPHASNVSYHKHRFQRRHLFSCVFINNTDIANLFHGKVAS